MSKISIVQLCSYYIGSKVHKNLFTKIDGFAQQYIFVPVRDKKKFNVNNVELKNGILIYAKIWSIYHRIFFRQKIKKAKDRLVKDNVNLNYRLIHSHTWFSDGGTAFLLNKKYKIPYIIAVRDTDINIFYKKLPFKKRIGHKILKNASKIVFLSPAYKNTLLEIIPNNLAKNVKNKSAIIPNGVDEFWIENSWVKHLRNSLNKTFVILFVGEITHRKNVEIIIRSFKDFHLQQENSILQIVGFENKSDYEKKIKSRYSSEKCIQMIDRTNNRDDLLNLYRNADLFVMPSRRETFGLVYIEALTQGVPIIYSKGHGIDGYFDEKKIGLSVNPNSQKELTKAIFKIYTNYANYLSNNTNYLEIFRWYNISLQYKKLYEEILDSN